MTDTRKPYNGSRRTLVLAFDVGTTFSGVSYAILEPGEVPKIHGVTQFPGQEHVAGNSKIPTIMYYDANGKMQAAGAEADSPSLADLAEDKGWLRIELFKLRLRPRTMKLDMNGMRLPSLPYGKTAVDVFGEFLGYLFRCSRSFIIDTHANGKALWHAVERDLQLVLSHPNGWEGAQQTKMRHAAVIGGLIPDTDEGRSRIRFVTEGEASLHACVLNGLANEILQNPSGQGFLVADAGGGTLDISSYAIRGTSPLVMEEIAPPDCVFAGSVFVSRRAREFLEEKLKGSKYGNSISLDHITRSFDSTTKRLFRDRKETQYIQFGSPLDKDISFGIRHGQLRLTGNDVAALFEPSIEAAVNSIRHQIEVTKGMVKSVWLVGGFAASTWLFTQLQERLAPDGVVVSRPDSQTSKAVADGAIGFYCDHHVSARMSKHMYGVEFLRELDDSDPEHVARRDRMCELPSGPKLLADAFDCILARAARVKESTVFTRKYCTEVTSLSTLSVFEVEIWCYRGQDNTIPKWINRGSEDFSTLCVVQADLSPLAGSAQPKSGRGGRNYWTIVFSVEIHFGLTEFRARIKWVDNGKTRYGPASIVYNEGGTRGDEDDLAMASDQADDDGGYYTPPRVQNSRNRSRDVSPPQTQPAVEQQSPITVPPIQGSVRHTRTRTSSSSYAASPAPESAEKDKGKRRESGTRSRGMPPPTGIDIPGAISPSSSAGSRGIGQQLTSVWGNNAPSNPSSNVGSPMDERPPPSAIPSLAVVPEEILTHHKPLSGAASPARVPSASGSARSRGIPSPRPLSPAAATSTRNGAVSPIQMEQSPSAATSVPPAPPSAGVPTKPPSATGSISARLASIYGPPATGSGGVPPAASSKAASLVPSNAPSMRSKVPSPVVSKAPSAAGRSPRTRSPQPSSDPPPQPPPQDESDLGSLAQTALHAFETNAEIFVDAAQEAAKDFTGFIADTASQIIHEPEPKTEPEQTLPPTKTEPKTEPAAEAEPEDWFEKPLSKSEKRKQGKAAKNAGKGSKAASKAQTPADQTRAPSPEPSSAPEPPAKPGKARKVREIAAVETKSEPPADVMPTPETPHQEFATPAASTHEGSATPTEVTPVNSPAPPTPTKPLTTSVPSAAASSHGNELFPSLGGGTGNADAEDKGPWSTASKKGPLASRLQGTLTSQAQGNAATSGRGPSPAPGSRAATTGLTPTSTFGEDRTPGAFPTGGSLFGSSPSSPNLAEEEQKDTSSSFGGFGSIFGGVTKKATVWGSSWSGIGGSGSASGGTREPSPEKKERKEKTVNNAWNTGSTRGGDEDTKQGWGYDTASTMGNAANAWDTGVSGGDSVNFFDNYENAVNNVADTTASGLAKSLKLDTNVAHDDDARSMVPTSAMTGDASGLTTPADNTGDGGDGAELGEGKQEENDEDEWMTSTKKKPTKAVATKGGKKKKKS